MAGEPLSIIVGWTSPNSDCQMDAIEKIAFAWPWLKPSLTPGRDMQRLVVIHASLHQTGEIVGCLLYEVCTSRLILLSIVTSPDYLRRGIGKLLVEKMIGRLDPRRRTKIVAEIHERNLVAQKFLRSLGFAWEKTLKNYQTNDAQGEFPGDAYRMAYRCPKGCPAPTASHEVTANGEGESEFT